MTDIPENIIDTAAQGDEAAFEEIFRAMSPYVYNIAFRVVSHQEGAADVCQEVFLKVYENLEKFRHGSSLKTWVYRITVNTSINFVRKNHKELARQTRLDEEMTAGPDKEEHHAHSQKEHHHVLAQRLLNTLSPKLRACIVLRDMEGLNYQEIAGVLKVNINTVRSRIKRARAILLNQSKKRIYTDELS